LRLGRRPTDTRADASKAPTWVAITRARPLRQHEQIHAEIGEIVAGLCPGRTSPTERIVFWHRGFAVSDIVVGHAVLARAEAEGVGTILTLFDMLDE